MQTHALSIALSAFIFLECPQLAQATASQKIVTAAQVNGTWRSKTNVFRVLALGKQRLRIEFKGIYPYKSQMGPMVNTGEASGIAHIEGDTAIFHPDDAEPDCVITLHFTDNELVVTQEGICDFGLNVSAQGTYKKTDSRRPKFKDL